MDDIYTLKYTDNARTHLKRHFHAHKKVQGLEAAKNLLQYITEKTNTLLTFPELGPRSNYPYFKNEIYRLLFIKHLALVYTISTKSKTIYIRAIFDQRQNYLKVLGSKTI